MTVSQYREIQVRRTSSHWNRARALFPLMGTLLVALTLPGLAQMGTMCGTNETALLSRALDVLNMTPRDLAFDKDHGEPRWCLPWVRSTLNDPLALPRAGDRLLHATVAGHDAIWREIATFMDVQPAVVPDIPLGDERIRFAQQAPGLASGLEDFMQAARSADNLLQRAFARLDETERGLVATTIFSQALKANRGDVQAALVLAGVQTQVLARVMANDEAIDPEPAITNFLALAGRIDQSALFAAGQVFQRAAVQFARFAASASNWPAAATRIETDLGAIEIDPAAGSSHERPCLLLLDRGGRSVYGPRACSASGLRGVPLAAVIDLGGDDHYEGPAGSAMFGVCVVVDAAGRDSYFSDFWGQGAAVCGVGWLLDFAGDDRYDAATLAQGAAGCGVGVLRDGAGNDIYNLGVCGQGFAFFKGFGLLNDAEGSDRFLAGNRENDWDRNSGRFLSLAQGFSIGIRGFAGGGIGALVDRSGNDTYVADVYGQGASYWYSAGLLIDAGGIDNYTVYQYGQGTGIHLSLGLLADFEGNDRYTGYILSQGTGHDFGVGMLFDHAGDDTYVADHHAQGRALNTSVGVLVDSAGDDGYFARQNHRAQGIGNNGDTRETGSIALLVDGGGKDQYSCGASNNTSFMRPLFGVVLDAATNAPAAQGVPK